MKKLLLAAILLSLSSVLFAATLVPVQLLNPTGSSSGQAIVSTGSSSAPAWGSVSASAISGVLTVPQGGIGGGSLAQYQPLAGSGTGPVTTLGTGSTGQVLTSNGGSAYPSFQAIPWASPSAIGATTPAAGSFTTLNASGNDALFYQTTNAQSIPPATPTTVTTWTAVFDRLNTNFNSTTGTFTAPVSGYYQVSCQLQWAPAAGIVGSFVGVQIVANGTAVALGQTWEQATGTTYLTSAATALVRLTAGQTIVIQAYQTSGSTRALTSNAAQNYLSINRLP